MNELTVGHYQYHKIDTSVRWFRKGQNLDGGTVDIRTGKRISTANNEIVMLRAEVARLQGRWSVLKYSLRGWIETDESNSESQIVIGSVLKMMSESEDKP